MRYIIMTLIFVLTLVLPGTVFYYWSWSGIKPDLAMLWVIYLALHHRPVQGVAMGLVSGFLVDIYLGRYIGMYTMTLAVIALLGSLSQQRWYKENIALTTVLVFVLSLLGQIIITLLANISGLNWFFGDIFKAVVGVSLYNALLVPLTYPLIHRSFTSGLLRPRSDYE